MDAAQVLYRKMGFQQICQPLGNTGHFACDHWFLKDLS
jgi:putative acetyltransferase